MASHTDYREGRVLERWVRPAFPVVQVEGGIILLTQACIRYFYVAVIKHQD